MEEKIKFVIFSILRNVFLKPYGDVGRVLVLDCNLFAKRTIVKESVALANKCFPFANYNIAFRLATSDCAEYEARKNINRFIRPVLRLRKYFRFMAFFYLGGLFPQS